VEQQKGGHKQHTGGLSKKTFARYAETDCTRQLFLHLAAKDDQNGWWAAPRTVGDAPPTSPPPTALLARGGVYEQEVYRALRVVDAPGDAVRARLAIEDGAERVAAVTCGPEGFAAAATCEGAVSAALLLEHQVATPRAGFLSDLLGTGDGSVPVLKPSKWIRPDLLVACRQERRAWTRAAPGAAAPPPWRALTAAGEAVEVVDPGRIALNILDVKNANPDFVGRKQFAELLFYAHALAVYLEQRGLDGRFFVNVDGMGILPHRPLDQLRASLAAQGGDALRGLCVPMPWGDHHHLYARTAKAVRALRAAAPVTGEALREAAPVRMQPACSRCRFFKDCVGGLGGGAGRPGGWQVELIPYTSPSVARLLREAGMETVADVAARVEGFDAKATPTPLYTARPLLWLKAQALLRGREVYASEWSARGRDRGAHLSMALPPEADIAIVFNAEAEPTYGVVFAAGLHLEIQSGARGEISELAADWWALWLDAQGRHDAPQGAAEALAPRLAALLFEGRGAYGSAHRRAAEAKGASEADWYAQRLAPKVARVARTLWSLQASAGLDEVTLQRRPAEGVWLRYQWAGINGGLEAGHERALAERVLSQLHAFVTLAADCEDLLALEIEAKPGQYRRRHPITAGFFWSRDQLQHLQDLLERHYVGLCQAPGVQERFYEMLGLLAPSGTLQPHRQARKLYDIRAFIETTVGLPGQMVNYTWHALAEGLAGEPGWAMGSAISRDWWPAHFNYMEFGRWHDWLADREPGAPTPEDRPAVTLAQLVRECSRKTWTLLKLMRRYHERVRGDRGIAWDAAAVGTGELIQNPLEVVERPDPTRGFNPIARLWAMNARLQGAAAKLEADEARLSFPARAIGGLAAGQLSRIRPLSVGDVAAVEGVDGRRVRLRLDRVRPAAAPLRPTRGNKRTGAPPKLDLRLVPPDELASRPERYAARLAAPREEGSLVLELEVGPEHPLLEGADVAGWCLARADQGLVYGRLEGMSANMKLKVSDRLLLVPQSRRGTTSVGGMAAAVLEKRWAPRGEAPGYDLLLRASGQRGPSTLFKLPEETWRREPWYLFPSAEEYWSSKLFTKKDGNLLGWGGMGASWFGLRRALLDEALFDSARARLSGPAALRPPETADVRELYLYAPELLPAPPPAAGPLRSAAYPPPDDSQAEAILRALSSTVSCIQGPPGTGKSATIATLIDEFLHRAGRPVRVLVMASAYVPLLEAMKKIRREHREEGSQRTLASSARLVFLRGDNRDPVRGEPGLPEVVDLVWSAGAWPRVGFWEGEGFRYEALSSKRRVDAALGEGFILFGNPHQLFKLGARTPKQAFRRVAKDFGFDLIVVDEASQLPVDQLLPALNLSRGAGVKVRALHSPPSLDDAEAVRRAAREIEAEVDAGARLTQLVLVGDHNQLPPVQPVQPPEALGGVLGSLFSYYVEGQPADAALPRKQLGINYRSDPQVVDHTRSLQRAGRLFYEEGLDAFRVGRYAYDPLPAPPASVREPWIRTILDPSLVVGTLIHERESDTQLSPLEASLVARLVAAFFEQSGVSTEAHEQAFWREEVGVVAPHNAHGQMVRRQILRALDGRGPLAGDRRARLEALEGSVYTVEKFQGSARTFILASMGCSAQDTIGAQERFLYDLNRFNVLTSRAKQKMVVIASRSYLDWVPRDREVVGWAARIRAYAFEFCEEREVWAGRVSNERGGLEPRLTWRWKEPEGALPAGAFEG